jgi:tetratricopeptide (TPR) repeat protein
MMDDSTGATADLTNAIELYSRDREMCARRGRAHQSKGNFDAGVADLDRARSVDAQLSLAYYDRSRANAARQDSNAAARDLAEAAKLNLKRTEQVVAAGKPLIHADDR